MIDSEGFHEPLLYAKRIGGRDSRKEKKDRKE